MKTKVWLIIAGVVLLMPGQLRALDIDFYSDDTIEDGDVYDIVSIYDTPPDYTTVDMFSGSVITLITYDSSIANIYAGEITGSIETHNLSTVNIHGGSVSLDFLAVEGSSTLNVFGGDFLVGNSPMFSESSTVNIYGYGFDYDGFELTGFLSDSSPFTMREVSQSDYEHITLIPEPSSLILLALGTLVLRRRKNN